MALRSSFLTDYWHEMQARFGYQEVRAPLILSRSLLETSDHWDHYKRICTPPR